MQDKRYLVLIKLIKIFNFKIEQYAVKMKTSKTIKSHLILIKKMKKKFLKKLLRKS